MAGAARHYQVHDSGIQPRPGDGARGRWDPGQHGLARRLLGDDLDKRREQLRVTLPSGAGSDRPTSPRLLRVMTNTALTGTTYDIGGGQQLAPGV